MGNLQNYSFYIYVSFIHYQLLMRQTRMQVLNENIYNYATHRASRKPLESWTVYVVMFYLIYACKLREH